MSSEYGWTTEQILTLTYRELDERLTAINKRINSNRKWDLSIQGLDPNILDEPSNEPVELSKEVKETMDRAKAKSLEGIRARHAGRTSALQNVPNTSP